MNNPILIIVTIVVAIASLLYELILAQMMSSIYGGTIFYYILVIGIYVFFLGMGSLFYPKIIKKDLNKNLLNLEIILAVSGALAPITAIFIDHFFHNIFGLLLNFSIIGWIGFLSGIELPLLMDLYNKKQNSYSGYILFVDFFGTFLACALFPTVLIPYFHLFEISFIVGIMNLIVIFLIPFIDKETKNPLIKTKLITISIIISIFIAYFSNSNEINNFIIKNYFLHLN